MDGDGAGIVAIVQNLKNAGLAVTMMGRHTPGVRLESRNYAPPTRLAQAKSSVETSTKGLILTNKSAQVCDDRYTSSYQLAHCHARPSSPPIEPPEFPQQRTESCRIEGNFDIGGHAALGSCQKTNVAIRPEANIRTCSPNRSQLSNSQYSRTTETFVQSLRKYPSVVSNRNLSSDLLQRLVSYSQAKNFTKSSCHFKSYKNEPNKRATKHLVDQLGNPSKSVQTYTRTQTRSPGESGEGRRSTAVHPRYRMVSARRRNSRHKDHQFNETYDYLRSQSPTTPSTRGRTAEIRYLDDFTQFLKQLYSNQPQVCPNVHGRYHSHRREIHRDLNARQSTSESNNMEAQASVPIISRGVSTFASCSTPPQIHRDINLPRIKMCCYCKSEKPCNCTPDGVKALTVRISDSPPPKTVNTEFENKLNEHVNNWAQELPVYSNDSPENRANRETILKGLVNKLTALERDEYFEENAKNEILECIGKLPMWYPGNKRDLEIFKAQIVDNLMNNVHNLITKLKKDKNEIAIWVDNISFEDKDTNAQNVDSAKIKEDLVDRLTSLAINPPSDRALNSEVANALRDFPIRAKGNKDDYFNNITSSLANKLKNIKNSNMESNVTTEDLEKRIWDCLEEVPDFVAKNQENINVVKTLLANLEDLIAQDVNGKEIQDKTQDLVNDWLDKNIKTLNRRTKKELANKLVRNLVPLLSREDQENKDSLLLNKITEWLKDIPELGCEHEYEKISNQLADTINELTNQGVEENLLKQGIHDLLNSVLAEKNKQLDHQKQNIMIENLVDQINQLSDKEQNGRELKTDISRCLENIANLNEISQENKQVVNKLAQKIQELQLQSGNEVDAKFLKSELVKLLEKFCESVNLGPKKKEELLQKLVTIAKASHDTSSLSLSKPLKSISKSLQEDISTNVRETSFSSIRSKKDKFLSDQIMRGDTGRFARKMSDIPMRSEGSKFPEKTGSPDFAQNLSTLSSISDKPPIQKLFSVDKIQKELFDLSKDLTGNKDISAERKLTRNAELLAGEINDIISDPNTSQNDKKELLHNAVMNHFQELGVKPTTNAKAHIKQFVDRLQNMAIKTSTPISTPLRNNPDQNFRSRRASKDSMFSSITKGDNSLQYNDQSPISDEEHQYTSIIINKIDSWLRNLAVKLDTDEEKAFRDVMIRDLAGDIIDRQKYLQLNPSATFSEEEELEYLKYQVFRWLNKLPNSKQLMPLINKTTDLLELIKSVPVPKLTKVRNGRDSFHLDTIYDEPNDLSFTSGSDTTPIQNEILQWINGVPSYLYASTDKEHHRKMIQDLATCIEQLQNKGPTNETTLNEIVSKWLSEMLIDDKRSENKLEGLKAVLVNKGLVKLVDTERLVPDDINVVEEDLNTFLLEWLKDQPWYQQRSSRERRGQEKVITDLSHTLTDSLKPKAFITDDDTEASLLKKIRSHIEKCLKDFRLKNNDSFFHNTAVEILDIVKPIINNQDQINQDTRVNDDKLTDVINDCLQDLPMQAGKTIHQFKADVDKFVSSLKEIKNKSDNNDKVRGDIVRETSKLFSKLPFNRSKINAEQKKEFIDKLLKGIKEDPYQNLDNTRTKSEFKNTMEVLNDNIDDWCERLPIPVTDALDDAKKIKRLKHSIGRRLINKIADLNMKPEVLRDEVLYEDLLNDEIDELVNALPNSRELQMNLDNFKRDLLEKVKDANRKTLNELAGDAYRQQLRDAISKTLPFTGSLNPEEQEPFEVLKDNLADAFINLHYSADNAGVKNKYKKNMIDEITHFCNEYLNRFPASPFDPEKLNQDLYSMLKKVPNPNNETLKSQVEQMRIRDEINDWIKSVPLDDQKRSSAVQKNKVVAMMAKFLHNLEKEKMFNPEIDAGEIMKKEILKWTKKLPLKSGAECNIDDLALKLVDKLKATEHSRRFSISNRRNSSQGSKSVKEYNDQPKIRPQLSLPVSTLNTEDRQHLERIRRRSQEPPIQFNQNKDAAVSPIPVDASNQTITEPPGVIRPVGQMISPQSSNGASYYPLQNQPLSPHVIVNEYNWNTADTSHALDPGLIMQQPQALSPVTFSGNNLYTGQPSQQLPQFSPQQPQQMSFDKVPEVIPGAMPQPYVFAPQPRRTSMQSPLKSQAMTQEKRITPEHSACAPCAPFIKTRFPQSPPPSTSPMRNNDLRSPDLSREAPPKYSSPKSQNNVKVSDMSSSTPLEENADASTSRSFAKPQVTHLGSFDNVQPCRRPCEAQPKPRISRGSPEEESEWRICFPENIDFWGKPCPRRRPCKISEEVPKKAVEKSNCQCRDHMSRRWNARRLGMSSCCHRRPMMDSMQKCSKCCGAYCPHPSYMYFK